MKLLDMRETEAKLAVLSYDRARLAMHTLMREVLKDAN